MGADKVRPIYVHVRSGNRYVVDARNGSIVRLKSVATGIMITITPQAFAVDYGKARDAWSEP